MDTWGRQLPSLKMARSGNVCEESSTGLGSKAVSGALLRDRRLSGKFSPGVPMNAAEVSLATSGLEHLHHDLFLLPAVIPLPVPAPHHSAYPLL